MPGVACFYLNREQVLAEGGSWYTGQYPSPPLLCLLGGELASGHVTISKIRAVLKSTLWCGVELLSLKNYPGSMCFAVSKSMVIRKYNKFQMNCRHTSEMLQVRFQTTTIKQAIIFLLGKGFAFNL